MVLVTILIMGMLVFTALSVEITRTHATVLTSESLLLRTRQIAESGLAEALGRLKEAGHTAPVSGDGLDPIWVEFGDGEYYYDTVTNTADLTSTIRGWGRVPVSQEVSGSPFSPDDADWDGTGYMTLGFEISVIASRFDPETPIYVGNGGVERPLGGFNWGSGVDIFDESTWSKVTSGPSSWQSSGGSLSISSLDHSPDYLTSGTAPTPATGTGDHPYSPWKSQTAVGQMNTEAWFDNSNDGGSAWSMIEPEPTTNFSSDPDSDDYIFPVEPNIPDVQDYAWALWNLFGDDPSSNHLSAAAAFGSYGTLASPEVTFATGQVTVPAGKTLTGSGILVIRDDYDPNLDTNNQPMSSADLIVNGKIEWTGLIIVAGWRPSVSVTSGGSIDLVGTFMGEDSVMSGGELSVDSATLVLTVQGDVNLRYSSGLFSEGGALYDLLPPIRYTVVGVRELSEVR